MKMLESIEAIKEYQHKMLDLVDIISEKEKALEVLSLQLKNDISNETDLNGKKLYTNDAQRQNEFNNRIKDLPDYEVMIIDIKRLKKELDNIKIEIDYHKNLIKYYELITKNPEI